MADENGLPGVEKVTLVPHPANCSPSAPTSPQRKSCKFCIKTANERANGWSRKEKIAGGNQEAEENQEDETAKRREMNSPDKNGARSESRCSGDPEGKEAPAQVPQKVVLRP